MKIVNKKRFLKSILIIIGISLIILLILVNTSLSYVEGTTKTIYVSAGDTLWSIARCEQENNEYYKELEIREIIYQIRKLNNLESNSNLQIGQKLILKVI